MPHLLFFSVETWILLIIFICSFVLYGKSTFGIFEKLGIPGPKPEMYFGTLTKHSKVYYEADNELAKKYGRIWGTYEFTKPMLAVMDPDMLKTILVKECFTYFTNRRNFKLNGDLYDAVSIAEDDDWRRIRTSLTPSFSSGRIKEMFSIMKQHSSRLTSSLEPKVQNDEVMTMKEDFGHYSMNVMMSCGLSVKMDPRPLIHYTSKLFRFSIPLFMFQACFPIFIPVLDMLGFSLFPRDSTAFLREVVEKIKAERIKISDQKSGDFLQSMVNCQTNEPERGKKGRGLTDHEITSQATMLLFAGYETSATTLTFLAYSLARNPQVMKRLQEEIDSTFPEKGPIDYEALMEMEYLDAVVNESLRLYPPAARLDRIAKETVQINGITIPKDMLVMIPIYALHRDPEFWPEPEEFKPERFSKANKQSINPYTYLPFGVGPRNCLGMRFALTMVKLALVEILQSYSFLVCEETEIPLKMDPQGLVGPIKPIQLKMAMRSI